MIESTRAEVPGSIVVFGAVHMDVLCAMDAGDPTEIRDLKGDVTFSIGGTGYNVAVNLAQIGVATRLASAMPDTGISKVLVQTVKDTARRLPIEPMVEYSPDLSQGAFCAFLRQGDVWRSVTDTSVEKHVFSDEFVDRALSGMTLCVLDANLSPGAITLVAQRAALKETPVIFHTVSDAKATRLLAASRVGWVFTNRRELAVIHRALGGTPYALDAIDQATKAAETIARTLGCRIVSGFDASGVLVVDPEGETTFLHARRIDDPQTFIGAGDALMAGTIAGIMRDLPILAAVNSGMDMAEKVIKNTHASVGDEAFEKTLTELHKTATLDALTGAMTRKSFMSTLSALVDACRRERNTLSVLFCDLNDFKAVNDTYGHEMGDIVLKAVVTRLKARLRDNRDFIGRFGGDEFVCLMPGVADEEAAHIANRLLEEPVTTLPDGKPVFIAIGAATWDGIETATEMLNRGDWSMYSAKQARKLSKTHAQEEPAPHI